MAGRDETEWMTAHSGRRVKRGMGCEGVEENREGWEAVGDSRAHEGIGHGG